MNLNLSVLPSDILKIECEGIVETRIALTREPGDAYPGCISCHPLRHTINVDKARAQHASYRKALSDIGLEVVCLERDDARADSCFVEDTAVVHKKKALICRPAKESRRGETASIAEVLSDYVVVKEASAPGTVEGGDVVHLQDRLISGQTQRTNAEGIRQMRDWLEVEVSVIEAPDIMHLKSYMTFLADRTVIATKRFSKHPSVADLSVIVVPDEEAYAADTLTFGHTVLMAKGYPASERLVRREGFDVVTLDVSEFAKCDGALTCLSIII